jgi:hypothetical protein
MEEISRGLSPLGAKMEIPDPTEEWQEGSEGIGSEGHISPGVWGSEFTS